MDVATLVARYPRLYHMAECGSWPSIRSYGLLSTVASLRLFGIDQQERHGLESLHRPEKVVLQSGRVGRIVLRDQKPMPEERLQSALDGTATTRQWYELINSRVFFWVSRDRLVRLLSARAYRNDEHDVLTVDTVKLVRDCEPAIMLCHMNSGNTFPMPHRRGVETFKSIAEYPAKKSGAPLKEVVELTVADQVSEIAQYVLCVQRMQGDRVIKDIPL